MLRGLCVLLIYRENPTSCILQTLSIMQCIIPQRILVRHVHTLTLYVLFVLWIVVHFYPNGYLRKGIPCAVYVRKKRIDMFT
jgi:hypothetical protein